MKCGLICARSARTSARASRARDGSSSASSSWVATQRAVSSAACTRPGAGLGRGRPPPACRRSGRPPPSAPPPPRGPGTPRRRQSSCSGRTTTGRPDSSGSAAAASSCSAWWSPRPSQASMRRVSVIATAGRAEQGAQVPGRLAGGRLGQPEPQRRRGQAGGVQRLEGDPLRGRGDPAPRPDPGHRPHRRHADQQQRGDQPRRTHSRMVTARTPVRATAARHRHASVTSRSTSSAQPQDSVTPEPPWP